MERLVQELLASFEARVLWVEQIVAPTHEMLEDFRGQREKMRSRLRDGLARTASLRKRDFDAMMQGILTLQERRQEQVKAMMRSYMAEQRTSAQALKDAVACGEANRIADVAARLRAFRAEQEERAERIRGALADVRCEQERLSSALERLLSKGDSIRVADLKAVLGAFQPQRQCQTQSWRASCTTA